VVVLAAEQVAEGLGCDNAAMIVAIPNPTVLLVHSRNISPAEGRYNSGPVVGTRPAGTARAFAMEVAGKDLASVMEAADKALVSATEAVDKVPGCAKWAAGTVPESASEVVGTALVYTTADRNSAEQAAEPGTSPEEARKPAAAAVVHIPDVTAQHWPVACNH